MNKPPKYKHHVSLSFASRATGISKTKLKKYIDYGLLVAFGGGKQRYRINTDDLDYFLNHIYDSPYWRERIKEYEARKRPGHV